MPNKEPTRRGGEVLRALLEHGDSLEKDVCNPSVAKNLQLLGLVTRGGEPRMIRLTDEGRVKAQELMHLVTERLKRLGVDVDALEASEAESGDGLELYREAVKDAQARVAKYKEEEDTADNTCMSLSVNDPDLPRWRQRSVAAGSRRMEAEADLEKAEADLLLMSSA